MNQGLSELKAMEVAFSALEPLEPDARRRATQWLINALDVAEGMSLAPANSVAAQSTAPVPDTTTSRQIQDKNETILSPKEFISQKKPASVAERIACLAYYLTHVRATNQFGAADISALNTEAASPKINSSRDIDNADRSSGYLVSAENKKKQITTRGEHVVRALPNREAVQAALAEYPHRKRRVTSATARKAAAANGGAE